MARLAAMAMLVALAMQVAMTLQVVMGMDNRGAGNQVLPNQATAMMAALGSLSKNGPPPASSRKQKMRRAEKALLSLSTTITFTNIITIARSSA